MKTGHTPEFYIPKMFIWPSRKAGLEITAKGSEQVTFKGSHNEVPLAQTPSETAWPKLGYRGLWSTCQAQI